MNEHAIEHDDSIDEVVRRARRESIRECLRLVRSVLPAHDDQSCCYGLRQNVVLALEVYLKET